MLTDDMTLLDAGLGANCVVGSGTNHTWLEANYDFESGVWNEYLNGDVSGGKAWSAWTQSDWDVTLDHNYFKVCINLHDMINGLLCDGLSFLYIALIYIIIVVLYCTNVRLNCVFFNT